VSGIEDVEGTTSGSGGEDAIITGLSVRTCCPQAHRFSSVRGVVFVIALGGWASVVWISAAPLSASSSPRSGHCIVSSVQNPSSSIAESDASCSYYPRPLHREASVRWTTVRGTPMMCRRSSRVNAELENRIASSTTDHFRTASQI
jgi:hypothetical protein